MNLFVVTGGLIIEGDIVSLSPSLRIESNFLVDYSNGARHRLVRKSVKSLSLLEKPIMAKAWFIEMYKHKTTSDQISEIITFLNSIGAIEVKRTLLSGIRSVCMRVIYRLYGVRVSSIANRRQSSFVGLNISILNAMMPIMMLVLGVSLLEYGAGLSNQLLISGNVIFLICLWLSTVIHEYVHVRLSKSGDYYPVVIQRGLRIGILHQTQSIPRSLASSFCGPLAGFLVGLISTIIINSFTDQIILGIFTMSVAIFHLFSWLPNFGDGKTLVKSIRSYYATTS